MRGGNVTGMEHAIEQVARVLIAHPSIPNHKDAIRDVCPTCPDADVAGPNSPSHAAHQARALADAGLLAPTPLREEWAARYVNGGGAIRRTRDEAESELDRMTRDSHRHRVDEPPAPEIAGIYARYVTDWMPVDSDEGDGSADQ